MKKIFITLSLIIGLVTSMSCVAFGATSYNVSLSTIDGIVGTGSSYAKDALDKIASEQNVYNRLTNKIATETANINKNTAIMKTLDPEDDADKIQELKDKIEESNSAIASYISQRNNTVFSIQQLSIDNNISIVQQGETAKESYIKYLDAVNSKRELNNSIKKEKKKLAVARLKYKKGIISKSAYITEKQNLEDLQDQISDYDSQIDDAYSSMVESLGVADDSTLNVQPLSGEDKAAFTAARNYNYNGDLSSLLTNSQEIKKSLAQVNYYLSQVSAAKDSDAKEDAIDAYNKALKDHQDLIAKTKSSFKKQFDSLQQSIKSISKNDRKISRAKSAMKTAAKKYKYGLISKNDYIATVDAYKTALISGDKNITALFPQILKYQLTVKGY